MSSFQDSSADNPAPLSPEDALAAAAAALAVAREQTATSEVGSALVVGADDAMQTKRQLQAAHSKARHVNAEVQARLGDAKSAIETQRRALEAQMRAIEQEMEPMMKKVARWQDGIAAVNLYLGRDEEIEIVRDGTPAPAGTPIVLRQMVLAMDEESVLLAENGGMDFQNIDDFLAWMMSSDSNLDQVLPDARGIVAIRPRRDAKNYGDPWMNLAANKENLRTWWLLRNGERLHLMTTEFNVGDRVTPLADEFTAMFMSDSRFGREPEPLTPGTREWLAAEESADARTRHYMKVALLLQGIMDRTAVFRPLDGAPSWLMQSSYDAGELRIVSDSELALTDGRMSFVEWQKAAIGKLEVGHRIVGLFTDRDSVHPSTASPPPRNVPHTIKRETSSSWVITYKRTDEIWRGYDLVEAQSSASYRVDKQLWGEETYVPLDTVELADINYYLGSRTNRKDYLRLIPALRAAKTVKEAEAAAEAPFAALIAAELLTDRLAEDATAADYAAELIRWWKTANRWHRALNGDADHERRAADGILREARRRVDAVIPETVLAKLRTAHPDALAIAARRDDIVVAEAQPRIYPQLVDNAFVTLHFYGRRGQLRSTELWRTLTQSQIAKWSFVHRTAAFDALSLGAVKRFTDEEVAQALEEIVGVPVTHHDGEALPTAVIVGERDGGRKIAFQIATGLVSDSWRNGVAVRYVERDLTRSAAVAVLGAPSSSDYSTSWNGADDIDEVKHPLARGGERPRQIIWQDDEAVAAQKSIVRERHLAARATQRRDRSAGDVVRALGDVWEAEEWERRRLRFMDDYADATLWPAEKSAVRLGRNSATSLDGDLRPVISRLLAEKSREELTGISIRELLPEKELDETVASLTIPKETPAK